MPMFPTPCSWITTSLSTGPLLGGTYNCNIISGATTPVSASTIYEYRAYSVIDGVPYYGNVLTGCTSAIPAAIPTVCSGIMFSANTEGGCVCSNKMCDDNNAPIAEYGILYTQQPSVSCDACLRYDKVPIWVCKQSICSTISGGTTYDGLITAMAANTTTYFRAFAKNSVGVGYGNVCSFMTCDVYVPPTIQITLDACTDVYNHYMAGAYCLMCCNGSTYAIVVIGSPLNECTYKSCTLYGVPAGCYYVDYSGVQLWCDGMQVTCNGINWDINSAFYGFNECCTQCFDYNANVCGCIY